MKANINFSTVNTEGDLPILVKLIAVKGEKGEKGNDGTTPNISASATVDDNTGTPSVEVEKSGTPDNPLFSFGFSNLKGEQGQAGATPNIGMAATVDDNTGTPSVSVEKSGTAENPFFTLKFSNLKGQQGKTPNAWRTIVDTTLTNDLQDFFITTDSDNKSFELKQVRMYIYVPQQSATEQTNGYLNFKVYGQEGHYVSFGGINFISKSLDNYWFIEVMPPNTFPACAKLAVSRPSSSPANVQMMFDRHGHAANNFTEISINLNGSARLLAGSHIIIEGIDK